MKNKILLIMLAMSLSFSSTSFASEPETEMSYEELLEEYEELKEAHAKLQESYAYLVMWGNPSEEDGVSLEEYENLNKKYEEALARIEELERDENITTYEISATVNEVNNDNFKVTTSKGNVYIFNRTDEELNVGEKVKFTYTGEISSSSAVQSGTVSNLAVTESAPPGAEYETGITYDDLSRNPDANEGKLVKFKGTVVQLIEDIYSDEIQIRFAINDDYEKIIYCGYDKDIVDSRILENDWITIYGTSVGLISYESTIGGMITIPAVYIDVIEQ